MEEKINPSSNEYYTLLNKPFKVQNIMDENILKLTLCLEEEIDPFIVLNNIKTDIVMEEEIDLSINESYKLLNKSYNRLTLLWKKWF